MTDRSKKRVVRHDANVQADTENESRREREAIQAEGTGDASHPKTNGERLYTKAESLPSRRKRIRRRLPRRSDRGQTR
jgi:hypothetical protein